MTTLYCGDCISIMQQLNDNSVDLVLCDLPYGTTGLNWDIPIPFDKLWNSYNKILKENATVLLFGSEPFSSMLRLSNLEMYKYDWVWEKNNCGNFQLVNKQPMKIHETISVFYNNPKNLKFSKIIVSNMERLGLSYKDVSSLFVSKNGNPTGWLHNKISGKQSPTREQWDALCKLFGIENDYDNLYDNRVPKRHRGFAGASLLQHHGQRGERHIQLHHDLRQVRLSGNGRGRRVAGHGHRTVHRNGNSDLLRVGRQALRRHQL